MEQDLCGVLGLHSRSEGHGVISKNLRGCRATQWVGEALEQGARGGSGRLYQKALRNLGSPCPKAVPSIPCVTELDDWGL